MYIKRLYIFLITHPGARYLQKKRMKTKPKHKLYADACALFVEQGLTCTAIAELLTISENTLSKWRTGMDWDTERANALSRPDKIKEILLKELTSVAEGNKARIDTDALSKISKTLQYFDGKVSLPIIVSVFKEFDNFVVDVDPHLALKFTEYHKAFINHRAQIDSAK